MANRYHSSSSRRNRAVSKCRARGDACAICWHGIDYALPALDPMSFEADDIVPVSKGGDGTDPLNLQATHRCCNLWRGNRPMSYVEDVMNGVVKPKTDPPIWRDGEPPAAKSAKVVPTFDW